MSRIRFSTEKLPLGGEEIPLLVGRDGDEPKTVFMSYEAFLDLAAALFTALETLKVLGVDPGTVFADEDGAAVMRQVGPVGNGDRAG